MYLHQMWTRIDGDYVGMSIEKYRYVFNYKTEDEHIDNIHLNNLVGIL